MAARRRNNWDVSYSTISWFENAIRVHKNVASVVRERDIYFCIERQVGFSPVRAILVNEYTLGLAALLRARERNFWMPHASLPVASGTVTQRRRNATALRKTSECLYQASSLEHSMSSVPTGT